MTQSRTLKPVTKLPADVTELLTMLQYKRPSGGKTEQEFIRRFILPLGATPDAYGNHWRIIGDSPILWSCHTDTVHDTEGRQRLLYGAGIASVDKGECLGADCGTGVWLMAQMIRAEVPGVYVFHADEEVGGYGSDYIAATLRECLDGVKFAIAFDRKGTDEIITHQMSKRCASDAFAESLARCLAPLDYRPSTGGTFTDTANYTRFIPECTNISVGYSKQHTKGELQDVHHALRLRDALLTADFSTLVCERDPTAPVVEWKKGATPKWWQDENAWLTGRDPDGYEPEDSMVAYIRQHADSIADFFRVLGYTQDDLEDYYYYGDVKDS